MSRTALRKFDGVLYLKTIRMLNKKDFFKITFEDIDIAEKFFQNDKHLSEFLINVIRYYRDKPVTFKTKIVQKYFETYKKVMDYIKASKKHGKKAHEQSIENQLNKSRTLEGCLEAPHKQIVNSKLLIVNSKKEIINSKEKMYREFDHLKISESEYQQLNKLYSQKQIDKILDSIQNYTKNKQYKSLYLTAKNWLEKEYPNQNRMVY